jgi:hypothetical protein
LGQGFQRGWAKLRRRTGSRWPLLRRLCRRHQKASTVPRTAPPRPAVAIRRCCWTLRGPTAGCRRPGSSVRCAMCALGGPGLKGELLDLRAGPGAAASAFRERRQTRIPCQAGACAFDGQPSTSSPFPLCIWSLPHPHSCNNQPKLACHGPVGCQVALVDWG